MRSTFTTALIACAAFAAAGACASPRSGADLVAAARTALDARLADGATRTTIALVGNAPDAVSGEGVELLVLPITGRLPRARVPVTVEQRRDARTLRSTTIWFAVEASRDALVYGDDARAGTPVTALRLVRGAIDATRFELAGLVDPTAAPDRRLRRDVRAGAPALRADLEQIPAVERNSRVRVAFTRSGVHIEASGTSRQAGMLGEVIEVLVDGADSVCLGRVTARGMVQVER